MRKNYPGFQLERYENSIILAVGIFLAALLRFSLREFESGDFHAFLGPWYDFIKQNGGFSALKHNFSNYTPPYLYLLALVTYLPAGISRLFAIKLISIAFDFLAAFFVYKIARLKYPAGLLPAFACLALLFAPTVFLNSSLWGQADSIYTTGLLACLYFLMVRRDIPALIAFGLAFSVKLQAIFFAPFLLAMFLTGHARWRYVWIIPGVYFAAILPAWLLGRPLQELLLIYSAQVDFYQMLSFNAPNLYQWLPNQFYDIFYPAGLIWAGAMVFIFCVAVYKNRKQITPAGMVQLALLSVLMMPYFLPKMHDRYFFAADVMSIVFAFYFPAYFFVPILVGAASLFSYLPFLFGQEIFPLAYLAILPAAVLVVLVRHLAFSLLSRNVV